MATTEAKSYKTPAAVLTAHPGPIYRCSKAESFTIAADADVVKFFKLPVNAKIVNGGFFCGELDTNASPTLTLELQVTNGTTTKKLLDGCTTGATVQSYDATVAGVTALAASVVGEVDYGSWKGFVTDDDNYYVAIVADAAPATAASANLQVYIEYTMVTEAGQTT